MSNSCAKSMEEWNAGILRKAEARLLEDLAERPVEGDELGALPLGVGAVAALDGNLWGIPLALGGAVLPYWSVRVTRKG